MTSGIDPAANAAWIERAVSDAAGGGADILFTPEMCGLLDRKRDRAAAQIQEEEQDLALARVKAAAQKAGIGVAIGSLAVRATDGKYANRSFVIDTSGQIVARYDKMHLFDVDLPTGESWRESAAYAAGTGPSVVPVGNMRLGLSVCYDLRFPALYAALSDAGATMLAVPAAFTVPTGKAHWHILLRARAIENACWVVAAAQVGTHEDGRSTFGHSLVIDPWGRVVLDMEETSGIAFAEIDAAAVSEARAAIPVLAHRRSIPQVAPS